MTQNFGIFPDAPRYISMTPKIPVIKPILTQKGMCTTRTSHSSDAIYAPTKMRNNPIRITNALGSSFFFATLHSTRDFSYSLMSFFINSSKVSHSNLNFNFLNFSYVSLETRICGYSDLGLPLIPGIVDNMDIEDIKVLSLITTTSTDLLRRCT